MDIADFVVLFIKGVAFIALLKFGMYMGSFFRDKDDNNNL